MRGRLESKPKLVALPHTRLVATTTFAKSASRFVRPHPACQAWDPYRLNLIPMQVPGNEAITPSEVYLMRLLQTMG